MVAPKRNPFDVPQTSRADGLPEPRFAPSSQLRPDRSPDNDLFRPFLHHRGHRRHRALRPVLAAAPAAAETKLKMMLNWKYQGPQGWFFLAQDRGYFKKAGIDITMDQGNGSGAPIPLVASGTYDVGFGDINALIQFAALEAGGSADRGLRHVQPAALHHRGARRQCDQDAEGPRRQDARRRRRRRRAQTVPGLLQDRQDRLQQDQDHQHAAEPARTDADEQAGRRRVRLRQHHPLFRQADACRGKGHPLHQIRRLRHGPLFERDHRLQEAHQGAS